MTQVFISYSRKDLAFVERLAGDLKRAGLDVWYDLTGLEGGARWRTEIQNAIKSSQHVLVVLSPDSVESEWVEREFLFASNLERKIIPLLYRPCELPMNYLDLNYIDVHGKSYRQNFDELLEALSSKPFVEMPHPTPSKKPYFSFKTGWIAAFLVAFLGLIGLFIILFPHPWPSQGGTETKVTTSVSEPDTPSETVKPVESPTATVVGASIPLPAEIIDQKGVLMRLIPVGRFKMGSRAEDARDQCKRYFSEPNKCQDWFESEQFSDEEPVHGVDLRNYYMDETEVTNAMYEKCVNENGACQRPLKDKSKTRPEYYGNEMYADYPVMNITWSMALTYCQWRGARLPTEAEWEKAARAPDLRVYPWGNDFKNSAANYFPDICLSVEKKAVETCRNQPDGYMDTSPVRNYPEGKSNYGLYDMAGNVWEWVFDFYQDDYYKTLPENVLDPSGPATGPGYVLRGGSASTPIHQLRSSARVGTYNTEYSDYYVGFRCARDASLSALQGASSSTPSPVSGVVTNQDWKIYTLGNQGSTIGVQPGAENSFRITFNLLQGDWAAVYKKLSPETLAGTNKLAISFSGHGAPNTVDVKLIHKDETVCRYVMHHQTNTNIVIESIEIPYQEFQCESIGLDLESIDRLDLSFSNWPDLGDEPGDEPGQGEVIIETIQFLR